MNEAIAIKVDDRYFYKFGKQKKDGSFTAHTAWSLAGAKLFLVDDPFRIVAVINSIKKSRPKSRVEYKIIS